MFTRLGVKLLYSVAYHPQTDGLSKRTNQTVEIALRFLISTLEHPNRWPETLPRIQRGFNNSASTGPSPNEVAYGFTPVQALDLGKPSTTAAAGLSLKDSRLITRLEAADAIAFGQMNAKFYYDRKHQPLFIKQGNYALIKLPKGYNIPSTASRKYSQQFVGPFQITEKVGRCLPTGYSGYMAYTSGLQRCPAGELPAASGRSLQALQV